MRACPPTVPPTGFARSLPTGIPVVDLVARTQPRPRRARCCAFIVRLSWQNLAHQRITLCSVLVRRAIRGLGGKSQRRQSRARARLVPRSPRHEAPTSMPDVFELKFQLISSVGNSLTGLIGSITESVRHSRSFPHPPPPPCAFSPGAGCPWRSGAPGQPTRGRAGPRTLARSTRCRPPAPGAGSRRP